MQMSKDVSWTAIASFVCAHLTGWSVFSVANGDDLHAMLAMTMACVIQIAVGAFWVTRPPKLR